VSTSKPSSRPAGAEPRFIFFGGKGGVGKTTAASAFALKQPGSTLIVSTDPAHSLGDVLGVKLSGTPARVARGLDAVELDAPRAFARWLRRHRVALAEILEHGTWLDRGDVDALLDLSIPGVDELAGFIEVANLASASGARKGCNAYDLVVVDTAPTGHMLRLMAAPLTVAAIADVLDALQEEHRLIRRQLLRVAGAPDVADRLIALLARQARAAAARLRDAARTTFHWVTIPEALSLAESEDGIAALVGSGVDVKTIVVNHVLPAGGACPVCDRRRDHERRIVAAIRQRIGRGREMRLLPAQIREPRGLKALRALSRARISVEISSGLTAESAESAERRDSQRTRRSPRFISPRVPGLVLSAASAGHDREASLTRIVDGASLLFVCGKGGVGKTTVSAAAALRLARAHPTMRVLLLSTDPAHSLADVFRTAVGDTAHGLQGAPKNLVVRELDAARAFADRRGQIERALGEIASSFGAGGTASHGVTIQGPPAAAAELIDLAPPGIDELFGVLSVVDARGAYDLVVIDTAPTGHALRLLEMPDAAREWTQVLLRVLLKYGSLVRPGRLAKELVEVSKSIRALQAVLRDPVRTRFVVVTRAADVPRRETARLLAQLRRLRLAAPAVVANALTLAPGRCARCRATAASEARELAALRRLCARRCAIIQTPLAAPAPRGASALEQWSRAWIGDD
jgi:arsenite-transporting ATPase